MRIRSQAKSKKQNEGTPVAQTRSLSGSGIMVRPPYIPTHKTFPICILHVPRFYIKGTRFLHGVFGYVEWMLLYLSPAKGVTSDCGVIAVGSLRVS